ncbi:hypothetical protein BV911_03840 [Pseudoruegeria sp. SK021]|nr:hypothetical protein BV911_03840 [Pseudoruegeria sp. SK021]
MADLHGLCFTTPRPWSTVEFTDILNQRGVFSVSAASGFALGRALAGEVELLTLAVDPAHRRCGTGARLLAQFEQAARARQSTEAFLEVADDNAAARALYARAGYVQVGQRPGYYQPKTGPAIPALILRKAL